MVLNKKYLACLRKSSVCRVNFEKLLVNVSCNNIHVMTAGDFRIIDVLKGHPRPIKCLSVSQISKAIVSYSQDLLIVHTLVKDSDVQGDYTIHCGQINWEVHWKLELRLPIINLTLSPLGDFLTMSGNGFFSVWTRDSGSLQSFSNFLFNSKEENKNIIASKIGKMALGEIVQQEISEDGRLIITLEEGQKTVKVWYQNKILDPPAVKKEVKKNDIKDSRGRGREDDKAALLLDFNPYADANPISQEQQDRNAGSDPRLYKDDLCLQELPQHRNPIAHFKILQHDLYESEKKHLANVILTVSTTNEVFMWYENILNAEMQFSCAHIFKGNPKAVSFDVCFLDFPPVNPKRLYEIRSTVSRLFDTSKDQVLKMKKDENKFGIYEPNYLEVSYDWLLLLNNDKLDIYRISGLRNFPIQCLKVELQKNLKMPYDPANFYGACRIFSASCRDFNDILSLYCLNSSFQIVKLRKNFKEQKNWKVDQISIIQKDIKEIVVHKQLPLIAYQMYSDEVLFFIEQKNSKQFIKDKGIIFLGAYSYHKNANENDRNIHIVSIKWVNNLAQLLIHFSDNTIALISSRTMLKILANQKYPEEYLKLWNEKRSAVSEKWIKIVEFSLPDKQTQEQEIIIGFEVLESNITESNFQVTIVYLTNKQSYYVYQTETKFIEKLKTLSTTTLLYKGTTPDNNLKLLTSSYNDYQKPKTNLLLLTEVDPDQAPPNPIEQELQVESEESDDGDIFAQFNKPAKKVVKKPAPVVIQAPQEYKLYLKLSEIEHSGSNTRLIKEVWKIDLPKEFKNRKMSIKMDQNYIGILLQDDGSDKTDQVLYIYESVTIRYLGFINMTDLLGRASNNIKIDFVFPQNQKQGGVIIFAVDTLYLLAQNPRKSDYQKWTIIKEFQKIFKLEQDEITAVKLFQTPFSRIAVIINEKYTIIKNKFTVKTEKKQTLDEGDRYGQIDVYQKPQIEKFRLSTYGIFTDAQKSYALFDSNLLKSLFYKGYIDLVIKILVQLQDRLQNITSSSSTKISDYLDMGLDDILNEITNQIKALDQNAAKPAKKETAYSMFDDFYQFEEPSAESKAKEVEQTDEKKLEQQFEEGYKVFLENLNSIGKNALSMAQLEIDNLVQFVKKFKILYKKDFFADKLTSSLMRQIYYETEEVKGEEKKEEKGALDMKQFMESLKNQNAQSTGNRALLNNWDSFKCALALYSENQDVIFTELQERFDFENGLDWDLMRRLGLPLWLKDISRLKILVEKIAKVEYRQQGDILAKQSKAERTALWYILLGKKNILATLYKTEPQNKKVHELLLNDFNEPKWKTTAEKNAMVLMSRKNNMLSCAFFVLAGNVKSALQVALGRLNDPLLGILICRLIEGEDSENLKSIYQEYFLDRGQKYNDPYMVSIGRWGRKEYVMALNSFQLDTNSYRNFNEIFKANNQNFNILHSNVIPQDTEIIVPLVSQTNFFVMDVIRAVKKNPAVKRMLNKNWALDTGGGESGSIFDDFFGGPSQGSSKKVEEKKDEKAKLDESKVLQMTIQDSNTKGLVVMSLIIIHENMEFLENMEDSTKDLIGQFILRDITNSLNVAPSSIQTIDKINSSIDLLTKQFEIPDQPLKQFLFKQLNLSENIKLQVAYLGNNRQEIMFKLEDQALRILDLVYAVADFPFIVEYKKGYHNSSSKVGGVIDTLEQLVESLIIIDLQPVTQPSDSKQADEKAGQNQIHKSLTITDPEREGENYSVSVDQKRGTIVVSSQEAANKIMGANLFGVSPELDYSLQYLSTKMRISLIIYMSIFSIAFITRKFTIVKDILEKLKALFQNSSKGSTQTDLNKMLDINFQALKIQIQKFRQQINASASEANEQQEGEKVQSEFEIIETKDYKTASKKTPEEAQDEIKYSEFTVLWLRYILSDNLFKTVEKCYSQGSISNLINIRPTIINSRTLIDATSILLNPRLKSGEILKKMHNLNRTLENITTYYFEKLLTVPQRSLISHELRCDGIRAPSLGLSQLFKSEKEYNKFSSYIEMRNYLTQLRDHELSIQYHTNLDYSQITVEKTKDLLQSGIDLVRMKGEVVNSFAFDRCGRDLVALALLTRGIREIPILSTLLYRNRVSPGLQIMDEECSTWQECLHRLDGFKKADPNIRSQYEPIISAIDRLYSYKTISYARKARRSAGTIFRNYQANPPEIWNGLKSSEYLKPSIGNEINHDDYSYSVESHPYLPLYVTGNSKGLLCMWNYGQGEDRSIDQWVTDLDIKNANPKKATIKKIQFSSYGEKIACTNMEGSFFMFRVDTSEQSKMAPIFSIKKTKELKFNDFEYMNNDSVFLMSSLKPKHTWIYDTLVPQRGGLVMENSTGGNIVQAYQSKLQALTFNEKPGQLTILDLKMNKVLNTIVLHQDEVTAVTMNPATNTLVVGFRDGVIKIYNMEKDFELREQYVAFTNSSNKRGVVSQLRIHPTNGALFASSQSGHFKLSRTRV